mgnify:CR=1 FL=1
MAPLLITLGIAALLLLLERMLRIFDFVINEGGPFSVVWRMLGSLAPQYLGLALPIGLFLGIQLGFRKLSLNSELDALQSSGIGLRRLLPPLLLLSAGLFALSILLYGFIQPYGRYAYANLAFEVRSGTLGASIKAGEFTTIGKNITIRIDGASDGGRVLEKIFIEKESPGGRVSAITAARGIFFATEDLSSLVLRLQDGVLLDLDFDQPKPRVLTFDSHDFVVSLPQAEDFRDRGDETLEMTLPELAAAMGGDGPRATAAEAAFNARIVRAISLFAIPFFAMPLGIVTKRATGSLGIAFGILVMLILHKTLEFGEVYSSLGKGPVWLTLWLPLALFYMLSFRLYYLAAHRVGSSPLSRLERGWDALLASLARMFRRRRPA